MAPQLSWMDLQDQALLKLSGLAPFESGAIEAALPDGGTRLRLAVDGVCFVDGELFEAVDPDRSCDLNGMLTRSGEWTGLTWSLRKRVPAKWPHPQLLRSGTAHNPALLPAAPPALGPHSGDSSEDEGTGARGVGDDALGAARARRQRQAETAAAPAPAPPLSDDDAPASDDGGAELTSLLSHRDMDTRLEAMGSIAAMLEIMPHIAHAQGAAAALPGGVVGDGTVDALLSLIRGDRSAPSLSLCSPRCFARPCLSTLSDTPLLWPGTPAVVASLSPFDTSRLRFATALLIVRSCVGAGVARSWR